MRDENLRHKESGVVILALFALIIIGVVIAAFLFVKRAHDKKPVSTTAAEVVEAGGSALSRNAQNVQRKNDASVVLGLTAEYISNNSGQLPVSLDGVEGLGYYKSVSVVRGEQDAVTTDQVRLATRARCLATGATTSGTARQFAAQFSTKNSDGSFDPKCVDG